jgi:hypothetical protein
MPRSLGAKKLGEHKMVVQAIAECQCNLSMLKLVQCFVTNEECLELSWISYLCTKLKELCIKGNQLIIRTGLS